MVARLALSLVLIGIFVLAEWLRGAWRELFLAVRKLADKAGDCIGMDPHGTCYFANDNFVLFGVCHSLEARESVSGRGG